ncbi:MAG: hypothetical protein H6678_08170 [Candidatus Delongbacteria bacterium]|nr:hypothetical protein [Candidatus Delongbacteria bacterium]
MMRTIVMLALCLWLVPATRASDRTWLGSNRSARILGMGGCYAANTRCAEAHLYNPAGLRFRESRSGWALYLDPLPLLVTPTVDGRDTSPYARALPGLATIRGLWLGNSRLALGLVPADYEPGADTDLPTDISGGNRASERYTPSMVFALSLDERISLGASGAYRWDERSQTRRLTVNYGLLVRVNKLMDVGAVAVNLSGDGQAPDRRWLDRVDDGTINVGLSWYPMGRDRAALDTRIPTARDGARLKIAADIRNVTQEGRGFNSQEMHLGASLGWRELGEVRAGIYWPQDELFPSRAPVRSLSVGLLRSSLRRFSHQLLPFNTLLDLSWMDNPLSPDREGLWIASFALGI